MGRSALLFALSAAAWGGCAVKSFSFPPGSPHRASSCKPAAPMGRTTLARSKDVDLLRATRRPAVAESAEYLENKEALKEVRRSLCNPACAWLNCFPWDVLTANTIFTTMMRESGANSKRRIRLTTFYGAGCSVYSSTTSNGLYVGSVSLAVASVSNTLH